MAVSLIVGSYGERTLSSGKRTSRLRTMVKLSLGQLFCEQTHIWPTRTERADQITRELIFAQRRGPCMVIRGQLLKVAFDEAHGRAN